MNHGSDVEACTEELRVHSAQHPARIAYEEAGR